MIQKSFQQKLLLVAVFAVGAALIVMTLRHLIVPGLLLFAGIIGGAYLSGVAGFGQKHTKLNYLWSLSVVLCCHLLMFAAVIFYAVPFVAPQLEALSEELPRALQKMHTDALNLDWSRPLVRYLPTFDELRAQDEGVWKQIGGVFSSTLAFLVNTIVVVVIAIYLALSPQAYQEVLLKLSPKRHRSAIKAWSEAAASTLRWWLSGRLASATLIGIASSVGLVLLGVPLPITLGLFAALMTFIPNIGPFLSVVPPALLALTQSPIKIAWVLLFYLGLQFVESYFLTPIIQRRAVQLPPALLLIGQLGLGYLAGILGIALASPLVAVALCTVKELYADDILDGFDDNLKEASEHGGS